jgi:hypothetical protein
VVSAWLGEDGVASKSGSGEDVCGSIPEEMAKGSDVEKQQRLRGHEEAARSSGKRHGGARRWPHRTQRSGRDELGSCRGGRTGL